MLGLMFSGRYLCVRASKIALGMKVDGIKHDALSHDDPSHFPERAFEKVIYDVYKNRDWFVDRIANHSAPLIHVHNEPNWGVSAAKEASNGRPVLFNVHDVTSARPNAGFDPDEDKAYKDADAFVFVSEAQREYAIRLGFEVENKPYVIVPNGVNSEFYVEKSVFSYVGGVCYVGGIDPAGTGWRDLSQVGVVLGDRLHIYPGNQGCNYGVVHPTEKYYSTLIQRIATHDWGFVGIPESNDAWDICLPNKFYEYLAAGIPVIVFHADAVAKVVEELGVGIVADNLREVEKISRLNVKEYRLFKKRVKEARGRLTMEKMVTPLGGLYKTLLEEEK